MEPSTDIPRGRDLYGATFHCACGEVHAIAPREMVVAEDALDRLGDVCRRALDARGEDGSSQRRIAILMDDRTREVAGREAARRLEADGWAVEEHVVADPSPGGSPACDDVTKQRLDRDIRSDAALLLAVGGGVMNDLAKWLAGDRGVPYAVLATCASMTGFTSANVAPAVEGVKTLVRAHAPQAVLADPRVLCDAPYELTAAGLGDAVAKCVSSADWRMNHILFDDFFCPEAVRVVSEVEPLYLERPEALAAREPEAVVALFDALNLTGVSMTMAGSSSPASGGEHLVSHALDMMSSLDGAEHDLHGRQVGVGTVLAAEVYARVLAVDAPQFRDPPAEVDRSFWGRLAGEVAGHYAPKVDRCRDAVIKLSAVGAWDRMRDALRPMVRSPQKLHNALERAGAAVSAEAIGCSRQRLLAAFVRGREMRERFTVLDLAALLGVMPGAAEEIVDRWA